MARGVRVDGEQDQGSGLMVSGIRVDGELDDDDLDLPSIRCLVTFTDNVKTEQLTCDLPLSPNPGETLALTASEGEVSERCLIQAPARSCSVPISAFILLDPLCMWLERVPGSQGTSSTQGTPSTHVTSSTHRPPDIQGPCLIYRKILHMVRPAVPYNVSVLVVPEAGEVQVSWEVPSVRFTQLAINLLHQVSYGAETSPPQTMEVTLRSVSLVMRWLVAGSRYTVMVRSRPGPSYTYFRGDWSEWSPAVSFTIPHTPPVLSTGVTVIVCVLLLLFLLGLTALCWENRIKPHVWPRIPDPKSALLQLYGSHSKAVEVSFDPDHFADVTESKVDMLTVRGVCTQHPHPPPSPTGDCESDAESWLLPGEEEAAGERGVGYGEGAVGTQVEALASPSTCVPTPDESYITMCNLYKTQ
ncbi:interleukin-7 receptor subunit alpha [Amblyraja radiata]|uniref:interleukin-7 receptor subunit alpha n=1 Tax=Amblyraja radiata TaxID=386614 RepID=UPI001401D2BB|nr:interleukin-7 receptor subunit alpha [Amblyraja radiata]